MIESIRGLQGVVSSSTADASGVGHPAGRRSSPGGIRTRDLSLAGRAQGAHSGAMKLVAQAGRYSNQLRELERLVRAEPGDAANDVKRTATLTRIVASSGINGANSSSKRRP